VETGWEGKEPDFGGGGRWDPDFNRATKRKDWEGLGMPGLS